MAGNNKIPSRLNTLSRACMAVALGVVIAAPVNANVLEEVVITARKREQSLQDVGVSVAAFSGDQMRELGFTQTKDLAIHTPGLQVTDFGSGAITVFNIRGVAQNDFADHQEGPVAVYNDGAYNSFLGGVGFTFFDLERVEVLRGPQGTLFGRNATGGLVHVISQKPTQEMEAYIDLQAGEYDLLRSEAAISGPLSENLSARLSLLKHENEGYAENDFGGDFFDRDSTAGRLQFLFEPKDEVQLLFNVRAAKEDNNGGSYHIERAYNDDFSFGPITGGVNDGLIKLTNNLATHQDFCLNFIGVVPPNGSTDCFGTFEDNDPFTINSTEPTKFERDYWGTTVTLNWQFDDFELVSITDFQNMDKEYLEDTTGSELELYTFFADADIDQFSQELRIQGETDSSRWVTGVYYLDIDGDYASGANADAIFASSTDNTYEMTTESWSAFAQLEYDLSEKWTAIAGFRWTDDEKEVQLDSVCTEVIEGICDVFYGGLLQNNTSISDSRSEGEWSGVASLEWRPVDDWMFYGKVSRGNKAGGFNAGGFTFFAADELEFDPEILTSFEAGFKGTLAGGKARLNASVFHYDYDDFQTFAAKGPSFLVFNVDSEVDGGEIELTATPWDGWDFLLGVAYLDATQKDVDNAGTIKDRPNPNSPEWSYNGLARYQWDAFGGSMAAQVDFSYVDERSANAINHPALILEDYTVANARLSYTSGDERWSVDLWVNNFTDEEYLANKFDFAGFTGTVISIPAAPRWAGATFRYNWF